MEHGFLTAIHHVQLAMSAGGEPAADAVYASDPFGNRIQVLARSTR